MIWPFSSNKLRSKSYFCNKYGYGFHYFIRLMTLRPLKGTVTTLTGVILGFSILSGTNSQILPPKRYDKHPRHFSRGVPPGFFLLLASNAYSHEIRTSPSYSRLIRRLRSDVFEPRTPTGSRMFSSLGCVIDFCIRNINLQTLKQGLSISFE